MCFLNYSFARVQDTDSRHPILEWNVVDILVLFSQVQCNSLSRLIILMCTNKCVHRYVHKISMFNARKYSAFQRNRMLYF